MDYKKTEKEIIEATKEFATLHNIHYDELTESMIVNAMRELNKCFISGVSQQSELLIDFLEINNWLSLEDEENAKGVVDVYLNNL